jgi:hypothetical protein
MKNDFCQATEFSLRSTDGLVSQNKYGHHIRNIRYLTLKKNFIWIEHCFLFLFELRFNF